MFCFSSLCSSLGALAALGASLLGFGILVAIHEMGHFLFAKAFGIATPTFSIGMGPKIFERMIGSTNFCFSLLPVGGYVEIATQAEEGKPALPYGSYFNDKPFWQKLFVMFGGILFNLICAFLIYVAVFFHGKPSLHITSYIVKEVITNSPAQQAGFMTNDLIKGFDSIALQDTDTTLLGDYLALKKGTSVTFNVERNGTQISLPVTLGTGESGPTLGIMYAPHSIFTTEEKISLAEAIQTGWKTTVAQIKGTGQAIHHMFAKRNLQGAGGPVMIFSESFKMAKQGLKSLLLFLAFISINLALINLLPLGALDGGQIFFVTLEWIIRRPLPDMFKIGVNLISILLFLALALYLTFFDIVRIFFKGA